LRATESREGGEKGGRRSDAGSGGRLSLSSLFMLRRAAAPARALAAARRASSDAAAAPAMPHPARTFFMRPLAHPAVAFASPDGRSRFEASLAAGDAAGFYGLIQHFATQDEPAFCGLASLAMALNALAVDPRRPWKGPWRYYNESLLDCCLPLERVARVGVTLPQAACLARCNGASVVVKRPPPVGVTLPQADCLARCNGASVVVKRPPPVDGDGAGGAASTAPSSLSSSSSSVEDLRRDVLAAVRGSGTVVIASYSRPAVGQTGDGHFSPLGAYHAGTDSALVLDTARFKYPPHWLPLETLHAAMRPPDSATGAPRGWMVVAAAGVRSLVFSLAGGGAAGAGARSWGAEGVGAAVAAADGVDAEAALAAAVARAPAASVAALVALRGLSDGRGEAGDGECAHGDAPVAPCAPTGAAASLLSELRASRLFAAASAGVAAHAPACAAAALLPERITVLLAALPEGAWAGRPDVAALVAAASPPGSVLAAEVAYVRSQWELLPALEAADAVAGKGGECGCREAA